jgi:hypothetical protein
MLSVDTDFIHLGYSHGQHDWRLSALIDGAEVGFISFCEYEGVPHVQMIEVREEWRESRIGSQMLADLQDRYDGTPMDLGMTTEDGEAFLSKLPWVVIRNTAREHDVRELERLDAIIANYEQVWLRTLKDDEAGKAAALELTKDWNEVSDASEALMRAITEQSREFRFLDVAAVKLKVREMTAPTL